MANENIIRAIGTSLTKKKSGSETTDWVIGSLTSIGEIGVESTEQEVTTLDSPNGAKEFIPADMEAGDLAIAGYLKKKSDLETPTKMMALIKAGSVEDWVVDFPSGAKWDFQGFVKAFHTTEETPDGLIGFNGTIRISGLPEYTAPAGT